MDITIGKARRGQLCDPLSGQAYVGRPSPLGNPFQIPGIQSTLLHLPKRDVESQGLTADHNG
jgi:hypothetical protein